MPLEILAGIRVSLLFSMKPLPGSVCPWCSSMKLLPGTLAGIRESMLFFDENVAGGHGAANRYSTLERRSSGIFA